MIGNQLKRWATTGLGLALLTKEKAEELVQELIRQGEIGREEGKELLEALMRRAQSEKDELQRRIDAEVRRLVESAGLASREDIRRLEEQLRTLEARLARLEHRAAEPAAGEEQER